MKQNLLIPLSLLLVIVAVLVVAIRKEKRSKSSSTYTTNTTTPTGVPFLPMYAGLSSHVQYNPADYLYGWEKYPHGLLGHLEIRVP